MSKPAETPDLIHELEQHLKRGHLLLQRGVESRRGACNLWPKRARYLIGRLYGKESRLIQNTLTVDQKVPLELFSDAFRESVMQVENFIDGLKQLEQRSFNSQPAGKVFIGHGRSSIWREFKDFLSDRLRLQWDEFNRESAAGLSTFERLDEMLENASFAFLIMTAEDQHADSTLHARENVIHEVGLFQGRLGPRKAIVLFEDGCNEFSNITGLTQIRFSPNDISSTFEEVRRVLERENIIGS